MQVSRQHQFPYRTDSRGQGLTRANTFSFRAQFWRISGGGRLLGGLCTLPEERQLVLVVVQVEKPGTLHCH